MRQISPLRCAWLIGRLIGLFTFCVGLLGFVAPTYAAPGQTSLVVTSPSSSTGAGRSGDPIISANGRYVLFKSDAPNLVTTDTNLREDFFVFDRTTGITSRIAIPSMCDGNWPQIGDATISSTGRYVVAGVSEWCPGAEEYPNQFLVLHDRDLGTTRKLLTTWWRFSTPAVNSDAKLVAFSLTDPYDDYSTTPAGSIWLLDVPNATTVQVDRAASSNYYNRVSWFPSISADGSVIAFASEASDLVADDSNGTSDIFVYTRSTGKIERVSRSSSGTQTNGNSGGPSISADGRVVVFSSAATNLVGNDTNGVADVFVRDRQVQTTTRVSLTNGGAQANRRSGRPATSTDGRYVSFWSAATNLVAGDTNVREDLFVRDRQGGTTQRVSISSSGVQGNGDSYGPSMSADGRYVGFGSAASNLVSGDTNRFGDVFVYDRQAKTVTAASKSKTRVAGMTAWSGSLSANGNFVVFSSSATNLVAGDTNNTGDVFVRDRQAGTITRVNLSTSGLQADDFSYGGAISSDGRFVIFDSNASNLAPRGEVNWENVFVRDRQAGTTVLASVASSGEFANYTNHGVAVTTNGRFVLFDSESSNLVPGDTNGSRDVFVRDVVAGTTTRVNVSSAGEQAEQSSSSYYGSSGVDITPDGRYVLFTSYASNLVSADTNGIADVFLRDLVAGTTTRVSVSSTGEQANDYCSAPSITPDGRYVSFISRANNLVPNDPNARSDVFVRDRQLGVTSRVSVFSAEQEASISDVIGSSISADGRYVTMDTYYYYYDPFGQGSSGYGSTYAADRQTGAVTPVSVSSTGQIANAGAFGSSISANGLFVLFHSSSTNLTAEPIAGETLFVHERASAGTVALSATPSNLAFGNLAKGSTSAAKTVTVTNIGTLALPIVSITLAGTNPGQFSQANNCPAQLSVGGQCTVSVKFKPTSTGSKSATLKVTPGGGATFKSVALSGTGI